MNTIPSRKKLAKLLSPHQVADVLGVEVTTLANWRHNKRYFIPYVKIGRKVMYPEPGVIDFIESRTEPGSLVGA